MSTRRTKRRVGDGDSDTEYKPREAREARDAPRLRAEVARLHALLDEAEHERMRYKDMVKQIVEQRNTLWMRLDAIARLELDTDANPVRLAMIDTATDVIEAAAALPDVEY